MRLFIFLLFAFLILISCSDPSSSKDSDTVTDIDGYVYKTVKIGNQVWMSENLKVTRYRNGDGIQNVTDNTEWTNLSTGAYCAYNNSSDNAAIYGLLYNWYAVDDPHNITPEGWHIPTDEEWKELEMFLGMSQSEADDWGRYRGTNEGDKLKATSNWNNDGNGTNKSGFSALPGGVRWSSDGTFHDIGSYGSWWSATRAGSNAAWSRILNADSSGIRRRGFNGRFGFSVRCVKD